MPSEGTVLVQEALGATLSELAHGGIDAFYRGAIAERIGAYAQTHQGSIVAADFAEFRAVWRSVHRHAYRELDVITTGAPTGGVHLLQALAILQRFDLRAFEYHSAGGLHHLIEATKRALAERRSFGGDPEYIVEHVQDLLGRDRIDALTAKIRPDAADVVTGIESVGASTTHFLVRDSAGNLLTRPKVSVRASDAERSSREPAC